MDTNISPAISSSIEQLFDLQALHNDLELALEQNKSPLIPLKNAIKSIFDTQVTQFQNQYNITHLIHERSQAIDVILSLAWSFYKLDQQASLLAVGGYGRGELHPYSDVDLLLLIHSAGDLEQESEFTEALHLFIALLWDIGLEVGHSVRTVAECIQEAESDITIISNLMESRLIRGDLSLYEKLSCQLSPEHLWPTKDFTAAKIQEKNKRYLKFNETAYNLEPNIKEGPGGLRDIQIIGWVAKRHFNVDSLKELVGHNFITHHEYEQLEHAQSFLWKIRFALHILCKRHEERLLFDYQRELAAQFGYTDGESQLAVEQFMGEYYQTVMKLERLNEMLLQYFQETLIYNDADSRPKKINRRFLNYRGYIAAANKDVFKNYPFALLEIFLLLCQDPELKGVRASTIRLIRAHSYLIDISFRNDLRCRSLFMEIIRQPLGITHEMRRMNRYGILAAYIPAFQQVVGQMQHDLYHAYTVDEHTLKVLRNSRRLFIAKHDDELPLASSIAKQLPKAELLYLATLFHDIAKGRGGRHETLGAIDAEQFCLLHDLNHNDTRLVSWLVKNHLNMSMTAQRKDINDPEIIHEFALLVGDINHLDYLYLLTVSDIRATSPKVWNSWKDSLLSQLYTLTKQALHKGLESPQQQDELIQRNKQTAMDALMSRQASRKYAQTEIEHLWANLPDDYFMKFQADEIIWQTESILEAAADENQQGKPIVNIKVDEQRGATEIFIHTEPKSCVFALVTSTLSQLVLDVIEAQTMTANNGQAYHTYFILEAGGNIVRDKDRINTIKRSLEEKLSEQEFILPSNPQRLSRTQKQFSLATDVQFDEDLANNQTIMSIQSANRPALLSHIGQALIETHVLLENARISTFGEKVEDVFIIRDENHQIITDIKKQEEIRRTIIRLVDEIDA